jgi:hypothetical protein
MAFAEQSLRYTTSTLPTEMEITASGMASN